MPKVINLRDTGGKVPEGAVLVDRRTKWGNPYTVAKYGREAAVEMYERHLLESPELDPKELRGKDLACWCTPRSCHGDILLERANQ